MIALEGEYLRCDNQQCAQSKWCKHLANVLVDRTDADLIWAMHSSGDQSLMVPMFPTRNLYWPVTLVHLEGRIIYKVETALPLWNFEYNHVTYLNPGEGMQIIRLALISLMESDPAATNLICNAPHHNEKCEQKYMNDVRLGRSKMQDWSIYTTKECTYCWEFSQSTDYDDAVPAAEGSPWNPWRK